MDYPTSPCSGQTTGAGGQLFTMLLQSIMAAPCNLSMANKWPKDMGEAIDEGSVQYLVFSGLCTAHIFTANASRQSGIVALVPTILSPLSRGETKLRSNDYLDAPLIYGNHYSDPADVETALSIIRFYDRFLKTNAMKNNQADFIHIDLPNCRNYQTFSEDYWRCYIRNTGTTQFHPSCTSKMGSFHDPTSVVDRRLRVHGMSCLRVADASIMPKIITGNTNAPTIMIGEKAADMIKENWSYTSS